MDRFHQLERAPVRIANVQVDVAAALEVALQLDHRIHDCLYLALACRVGAPMVTADRRLHSASGRSPRTRGVVRLLDELDV